MRQLSADKLNKIYYFYIKISNNIFIMFTFSFAKVSKESLEES